MNRCGQNVLETGITMDVADYEALQVLEPPNSFEIVLDSV